MKQHAILATLVAFTGLVPALHGDTPSPVMVKLIQIDLDVAIHHYEKLQGLLRDTELERMIGDGTHGANPPEQDRLERKIAILQKLCSETREEILKLGDEVEASRTTSAIRANPGALAPSVLERPPVASGGAPAPPAVPLAPSAGAPAQFPLPQVAPVNPPAVIPGVPGAAAPLAPPTPAPQGF